MSDIQRALARVRERIAEAALRAGRDPSGVALIAVSKTFSAEAVLEAIAAGQLEFGENRVEEALPKMAAVSQSTALRAVTEYGIQNPQSRVQWHLIGHLQSRKAKDAAGRFDLIHSVDSVRLAETLDRRMAALSPVARQDILLECNVSGETTKNGFDLAGWEHSAVKLSSFAADVAHICSLPHLRVLGLMTMAPIVEHPDQAKPFFASLRALRDALAEQLADTPLPHLSMGMTDDFEAAIAEGATLVRIGRAIFGARHP